MVGTERGLARSGRGRWDEMVGEEGLGMCSCFVGESFEGCLRLLLSTAPESGRPTFFPST